MPLTLSLGGADFAALDVPLLAIAVEAGTSAPEGRLANLDRALGGAIARLITARDFRAARDETMHLAGGERGPRRILLVGLGTGADRGGLVRRAAALAARQGQRMGVGRMAFALATGADELSIETAAVGLAAGAWEYTDLRTPPKPEEQRVPLVEATILVDDPETARAALGRGEAIAAGHTLARTLGMMPGNLCTPDFLAETARNIAERHGMSYSVMGRAEMERERMGAFLCVAQGTPQDPKLVTIEHRGGASDAKPIVLVGKGLCFDSGGISIKPAQSMEWMKYDMSGAGGVLGALEAIGRLRLPVNVVGIIGATTNMPSGTAVKPGDVVRSHLGKYIEIINTDAEGRLVLADLLSWARRFDPAVVIDAATLTGACVIALGHTATGVFGPNDAVVREVVDAGSRAGEPGWPLPLWDEYRELIKSQVGDIKNSGGRPAGAISAAMFLKEFTGEYPWVHLDVAGTAYSETDLGTMPPGPTGIPTGTFIEFVRGRVR